MTYAEYSRYTDWAGNMTNYDWARKNYAAIDLRGRKLAGAQLQFTNFRGADLGGADLRQADVRGAIFDQADLTEADLTGVLAQGASFRQATLHSVSFRQALLLSAHLEGAAVSEADFAGANLEWAWVEDVAFGDSCLSWASFLNARGLSAHVRRMIESKGGITGVRPMILGRELYEENPGEQAVAGKGTRADL